MMKKKINVYAKIPFCYGNGVIRGNMNNITLDIEGIRRLILAKNIVDEILPNGELLRLDLTNYNLNNDPAEKARIEAAKAAAEAARIEAERKAKEEAERIAKEEAIKAEAEKAAKEEAIKKAAEDEAAREARAAAIKAKMEENKKRK